VVAAGLPLNVLFLPGGHTLPERAALGWPGVHGSLLFRAPLAAGAVRATPREVRAGRTPDTAGLPSYAEVQRLTGYAAGRVRLRRGNSADDPVAAPHGDVVDAAAAVPAALHASATSVSPMVAGLTNVMSAPPRRSSRRGSCRRRRTRCPRAGNTYRRARCRARSPSPR